MPLGFKLLHVAPLVDFALELSKPDTLEPQIR
jgi:hypothetical protein